MFCMLVSHETYEVRCIIGDELSKSLLNLRRNMSLSLYHFFLITTYQNYLRGFGVLGFWGVRQTILLDYVELVSSEN
jgi:hypothetical protein